MVKPLFDRAASVIQSAVLFVVFCFVIVSFGNAQPLIKLDPTSDKHPISCCVEFLEDASNQLTFNDVSSSAFRSKFKKSEGSLNFGYSTSSYWIRFELQNIGRVPSDGWVLEMSNPIFDQAKLYVTPAAGETIYKELAGNTLIHEREVQTRSMVFNLPQQPDKTYVVYLMLSGNDNKMFDLVIWSKAAYTKYLRTSDTILSFYFGILFALAIYNLFLFFSIRDRSYLYYTLFVTSMASSQLVFTGWGAEYLGLMILKNQISSLIIPTLALVFGALFVTRFLSIQQHYPNFHRIIMIVVGIAVLTACAGLHLPFFSTALKVASVLMIIVVVLMMGSSIPLVISGQRAARFFLLGWSILCVAVCIMQLKHLGYLPVTPVTRYAMKFASVFEAIVFSFGLADRFHTTSMQLKLKSLEVQKLAESEKMKV